jgi:hypothetical protein
MRQVLEHLKRTIWHNMRPQDNLHMIKQKQEWLRVLLESQ